MIKTLQIGILFVCFLQLNCFFINSIGETNQWTSYNITNPSQISAENMVSIQNYGDYTQLANGNLVIGFQSQRLEDNYFTHNFVSFNENGEFLMHKQMEASQNGVIALIHTNLDNEVFYARQILNQGGKNEVVFGFFDLQGNFTRNAEDKSPILLDEGDQTYEPLTKRGNNLIYLLTYLYDQSEDRDLLYLHVLDISKSEKYIITFNHRLDEYNFNFYFAYTLTVYRNSTAQVQAYNNGENNTPFWVLYKFDERGKKEHGYPKNIQKSGQFREQGSQNARSYTYLHKLNNQTTTIYSDLASEFVIATANEDGNQVCEKYYNVNGIDMGVLYYGIIDQQAGWIQTINDQGKTLYFLFDPSTCEFDGESFMQTELYDSISGPYVDFRSRKIGILEIGNNYMYNQEVVQVFQHQVGSISEEFAMSVYAEGKANGLAMRFGMTLLFALLIIYLI
ncbi:hypothetical protein PPERSA_11082 [Pseudocohnilembus persalinus]|uniref:Transmembrane protein n=1 Tax=Pseudocohnilembus persalinus TaxID=266149 RepID=A0A0V0QZP0_PSEPJ|nr:hypothetical protein PPERSA_11082 [Pseudocohnilembus persalinus]|eukprot:KRX07533.1 hypothetical protein PPERSA_11082 [Pseudocohnilembus persalinus]